MSKTIVIQAGATNTISIDAPSVKKVEITCPEKRTIEVCSKVQFNVTTISEGGDGGGGFNQDDVEHQIDSAIDVTNEDTAIGDALGAYYPAGTDIEQILRDILVPGTDPTITNYRLDITADTSPQTVSSGSFEWGVPVTITGQRFTLNDPSDKFIDTESINFVSSIYLPSTQSFEVSEFGETDWSEVSGEQVFEEFPNFIVNYVNEAGYTRNHVLGVNLKYNDSSGIQLASANASLRFSKKRWLLSSDIDLSSDGWDGDFNDILNHDSTTIMDDGLTTSNSFTMTTDATALGDTKYTYIVIPSERDINTVDGSSISVGVFNVGNAFVEFGSTLSYFTGYTDALGENVNYNVRLFQSDQTQAYSAGLNLVVTTI